MNVAMRHSYQLIPDDGSGKFRDEEKNAILLKKQNIPRIGDRTFWSYTTAYIVLFISLCLNCIQLAQGQNRLNLDKICNAHTSQYGM